MIAKEVEARLGEVHEACRRRRVRALWLFGSATSSRFRVGASDLDFLVEFDEGAKRGAMDDAYAALLADLRAIFGPDVDLVERRLVEQDENYIRRKSILSSSEPLYVAA